MTQHHPRAHGVQGMQRPEPTDTATQASLGEGVLINGVDGEAARRAHMRELTTARQAAERARDQARAPYLPPTATADERRAARQQAATAAATAADATLREIEAAHQVWVQAQETSHG